MQESIQGEKAYWYVIDIFKKGYLILRWKKVEIPINS